MLRKNNLHKANNFKIPKGYFDNLEDDILDKISTQECHIPRTNSFKIPKGYFNNIEDRVETQLPSDKSIISLYQRNKTRFITVASIAAVFILVLSIINPFAPKTSMENIPVTEVEEYINTNYTSLFSLDIEDYFSSEEEIDQVQILNNTITEEELIEYLNENIDPYEELTITQ